MENKDLNMSNDIIDSDTKLTNPFYSDNNLIIQKDLKNLTVKAKGNIISYADCENCTIESEEGTVFLLYGSLSNTNIKAAKNIYVKHSMQSKLIAGKDVIIEKSMFMSDIEAGDRVISESYESRIIGGVIRAQNSVISNEYGNEKNVSTEITVASRTGEIVFEKIYPGVKLHIGHYRYLPEKTIWHGKIVVRDGKINLLKQ